MATTLLTGESISEILGRYSPDVDREMADVVRTHVRDEWLSGAIAYHLGWADADFRPLPAEAAVGGGKKVRPALALLSYLAVRAMQADVPADDGDMAQILTVAAALELLHNYSLAHDDIEDDDRLRRGRPTLWTVCGQAKAINIGDCLHALAFSCLHRSHERGFGAESFAQLVARFAQTSVQLTVGQSDDLLFEDGRDVSVAMYMSMIAGKTAALMSCATYSGALLALDPARVAPDGLLECFGRFGQALGLGFQVCDDILGIWGIEADTGKPTGSDIRRRKKSLPVLFALQHAPRSATERLKGLYAGASPLSAEDEAFVRQVLDDCGAAGFAREQAQRLNSYALAMLEAAADNPEVRANPFLAQLRQLACFMTDRTT